MEAQEYWSGQPIPYPADLLNPGIDEGSAVLQAGSLSAELPMKPASFVASMAKNNHQHLQAAQ